MAVIAICEVCRRDKQACIKIGQRLVCDRCRDIYNEVRTLILEQHT